MGLPSELEFVFGKTEAVFHRTRLISREMIAENTLALTIERPVGFTFEAGQNTMLSIPGKHAEELREFTMASAPYEKEMVLAMRIRNSQFKSACYALKPGDAISLRTPSGTLWQHTAESQIWLSGGIGITPFRSIVRELLHHHTPMSITHIHADKARASTPFINEFEKYSTENQGFVFLPTMTQEPTAVVRGRISGDLIAKHAAEYLDSRYFVVGTDSFVAAMRGVLAKLGVHPEAVRTEKFDGYREN